MLTAKTQVEKEVALQHRVYGINTVDRVI